jgi:hypothetical protein
MLCCEDFAGDVLSGAEMKIAVDRWENEGGRSIALDTSDETTPEEE